MRGTQQWPPTSGQPAKAAQGIPIGDGPHGDGPELVGYARVSTRSQKDDTQLADLTAAGCARIFLDHGVSGKHASRPELDKCVAYLRPGDTFVITRLSRAMRSLKHLLALTDEFKEAGIGLRVLKQDIDTATSTGRLVFRILGAIDEWQRELIVEGTLEGLEAARANEHYGGRPAALTPDQEQTAADMYQAGKKISVIAEVLGVARASVYRALRKHGLIDEPDNGHGGRPPVTPEQTTDVLRLLRGGESVTATHEATGLSRETVRKIWREAGEQEPPPGAGHVRPERAANKGGRAPALDASQARYAAQMIASGKSVADMAQAMKVSPSTVRRALERLGTVAGAMGVSPATLKRRISQLEQENDSPPRLQPASVQSPAEPVRQHKTPPRGPARQYHRHARPGLNTRIVDTVPCGRCGAAIGEQCRNPRGQRTSPHTKRQRAYAYVQEFDEQEQEATS